jgi:glycerophosphoryl diester phosphodiesterase
VPVARNLHRAGNDLALLALAAHPAVDAIEADVWSIGGEIHAHHNQRLGPLPFTIGRGGIARLGETVTLDAILSATSGHSNVVLDLRIAPILGGDPAADLVRALGDTDRGRIRVTCENWSLADRVRAWAPDLAVAYSVRSENQLRAYLAARDAGSLDVVPVVIRHTLLHTRDEVQALRERAGRVGAWTVDDTDRALALVAWGVDEITSNRVTVLNAL